MNPLVHLLNNGTHKATPSKKPRLCLFSECCAQSSEKVNQSPFVALTKGFLFMIGLPIIDFNIAIRRPGFNFKIANAPLIFKSIEPLDVAVVR